MSSINISFAQDNETLSDLEANNQIYDKSMLLIADNGGTNILDSAASDILMNYSNVDIQVRSSAQISTMGENELYELMDKSDIVIANWLTSDADSVLTNILLKYPNLSNKEMFLILETSSSSQLKTFNLVKNSTIGYNKIFEEESFTTDFLNEYFQTTKRGQSFTTVSDYLTNGNGNRVNSNFNQAVLYKNCNDKENFINQILWALNVTGFICQYNNPVFYESYQYGLYRHRYMTLDEYKSLFFNSSNKYTVGLLESNMYVSSASLEPYYSLIESLESKGVNVIPVVAAGGSDDQLKVMVKYFTNAPDYESFLGNSSNYESLVDAIISMPAYGIGGTLFDRVTEFFETCEVPVYRAVHSDYVSNDEWELSTTGLPGNRSDKWWHVAIGEAQGIIEATFVGGVTNEISNLTGAQRTGYKPHETNIDLFSDRIISWINLKYAENENKKISLIYYNYPPGKQNIGSSYLDSITSIYNLLLTLKSQGYDVGELPENTSQLEDMIIRCGINVATWAPGELEKLANRFNVVLLPVSEYLDWFESLRPISKVQVIEGPVAYIGELSRNAIAINYTSPMDERLADWYNQIIVLLPENYTSQAIPILDNIISSLKQYLKTGLESDYDVFLMYKNQWADLNVPGLNGWGEAPGNIMTVERNGTLYFVVPGLTFGNVFVAPEPQRGWEADSDALYHSSAVAPTHQYLAAYYYFQEYYSSAMVFVGRHATHEWLPGKEVLLSSTDYGSIVVGDVPQIYFYISDGLGEGIQAKRRGFAVMISHLTSPLAYTQLYGNLTVLANLVNEYENALNQSSKDALISEINHIVETNNYVHSMGINNDTFNNLSADDKVSAIDSFIKSVQNELYTWGLHALGQNWTDKDISLAVSTALSQKFTYNGVTTSLYDEIAQIKFSKHYDELNSLERDIVMNLSCDVVPALIYYSSEEVAQVIGVNSTALIATLDYAKLYINLIQLSVQSELDSFINALNGKYISPGPAGDVLDINSLPTAGNFFHDQSQELPTAEAYEYGRILTLLALDGLTDDTEKLVMGIWCVETARDDGALISVVLYLLGMEPVYSSSPSAGGYVQAGNDEDHDDHEHDEEISVGTKTSLMPSYVSLDNLVRPDGWDKKRIDVTVITSGNFRDLYSTQAILMDNAFRVALARSYFTILNNQSLKENEWFDDIKDGLEHVVASIDYYGVGRESFDENYVAKHWINDFVYYKELGYNTTYAAECAITRIFAPPNGDYGAGIAKSVSLSWTWNDTDELADFYLGRMGNMYSKYYWGETNPLVFARALNNTNDLIVSRNTNVYGVLDNDDFFDYWGGLSMAMAYVNGNTPKMDVLMYGNRNTPYTTSIEQAIAKEILTRYSNPDWISGMMQEGYSGARYISNKFLTDLLGWSVTRPEAVSNYMWDDAYNVYFNDKYGVGVNDWLKSGNNAYAFISSAGTLLTAAYEGYWQTDSNTLSDVANQWAQAVITNGVACCDCSCGNIAMMQWAVDFINPDLLAKFADQVFQATNHNFFNPANFQNNPNADDPEGDVDENSGLNSTDADILSNSTSSTLQSESSTSGFNTGDTARGVGTSSSLSATASSSSEIYDSQNVGDSGADSSSKSYEVEKSVSSSSTTTEKSMSIQLIICVIVLVGIFAIGYFRNKRKDEF
ncbi:cobaltochelatase subunit CobN [Methanobrevibacter sp.]|uniref:cobaltochelatase subunit CobN n=1 Tax=Methanobrevibacter sp. TaxID=66852 RepID=UPI003890F843